MTPKQKRCAAPRDRRPYNARVQTLAKLILGHLVYVQSVVGGSPPRLLMTAIGSFWERGTEKYPSQKLMAELSLTLMAHDQAAYLSCDIPDVDRDFAFALIYSRAQKKDLHR
jgi:hypothetical protein